MARYNKIFAGPVEATLPQVLEAPASTDLLPGTAVVLTAGAFAYAGAATEGKVWLVQDNYLVMGSTETAVKAGDVTIGMELLPHLLFNARVATGNNLAVGTELTTAASGLFAVAAAGDMVVATSNEEYNNNTGTTQLVQVRPATSYVKPAV